MHFNKKKLSEICAATLIAGGAATLIAPAVATAAATAAGTLIKNLATVTYEDSNGNEYSAQSNEAVITVKQVYSAELSEDKATTAAAGQTTYIQHTLTNTGNGSDTYTLDTANLGNPAGTTVQMYLDTNGNGLADAGEPLIAQNGTVTLAAGATAEIVLAVAVPNTTSPGDTIDVTLTATAVNGTVTDTGANGDNDSVDNSATNDDVITISADAVLNYTKSAVLNEADSSITYTLTITNTGNQAATDVVISDTLPKGMEPHITMTPTASGILTSNVGDVLPVFTTNTGAISETTDGIDYNNDGDQTDLLDSYTINATDASIAPGQTVNITFTADYDPLLFNNDAIPGSANDIAKNTASLTADLNGSGTSEPPISSNPTQTPLPAIYGIITEDTGPGSPSPGVNDGGDDDATANDTQTVDSAPDGSTVLFPVVLTNNGSGPDIFDLTVANGTFPPGTTFTFWNADGTVPLVDTNGAAGPDTGVLDSGEAITIMVKANLPNNPTTNNVSNGGTGYSATVTGTSSEDPDVNPVNDDAQLFLENIIAATVDLRDTVITPNADPAIDDDALNVPGTAVDANGYNIDGYAIVSGADVYDGTEGATVGGTVNIPFHIDNNSGSPDAFQISAGSSWNGTSVGSLPPGWSVDFYQADASGNPIGQPFSSTQLLAPNSIGDATNNHYVAVVQIPSDPAKAPANYIADNDGDAALEMMDANGDGDGDQPIFIHIMSSNSGSSDVMVDAIDIDPIRDITLTPNGANQIQAGGSVDYAHTLDNAGNTDEELELTAGNSLSSSGWNNNIAVPVDHDNDPNTAPINKPLSQLQPGDLVQGVDTNGNPVTMPVSDNDSDGDPEITVPAGVEIPLIPTVFAPAGAAPGTSDTLTINATSTDPSGPTATAEDVSEVIAGQVRLVKTVAHDADCNGVEPATAFMTNLTTEIPPGECALWQITAENQGAAPAMNVVVHDEVTAFTTYEPSTLSYSMGTGTTPASVTDTVGDDVGEISGQTISFYVGASPNPAGGTGGTLAPGAFTTVRFSTRVD